MSYVVIKCGGSVMDSLPKQFYDDIVSLMNNKDWMPVIVHGGGPTINRLLNELQIPSTFVNGLRVTSEEVLNIVEMTLSGTVNKQIVRHLIQSGGKAVGISGVDGNMISARTSEESLGFVGEVTGIDASLIYQLSVSGYIPVISPIGLDIDGQHLNINGDVAASAIASVLGAKLIMISDIPGIRVETENGYETLASANQNEINELISSGQITGGMIPKVKAALDGLAHDIPEVVILNGMTERIILDYLECKAVGTRISGGVNNKNE